MTEPTVLYEERGAVAIATLNRPQALNSFTRQMHRELGAAMGHVEANPALRAFVITGAGRGFCAGADLSEFDFAPGPDLVERANPGPVIDQAFNPTVRRLQALRVPTIAAVNGVAAGAGRVYDADRQSGRGIVGDGFVALYIFMLAAIAGHVIISRVPVILHTPLMSGSNFIHGIVLIGAMVVLGHADTTVEKALGFVAVLLGAGNAAGGYVVTERMLDMFKSSRPAGGKA